MCVGRQKQRVFGTDQTSFRSTMWREALPPKHRHLSYRREQLHTKPLKVHFPSARFLCLGTRGGPVCTVRRNERMPALTRTYARHHSHQVPGHVHFTLSEAQEASKRAAHLKAQAAKLNGWFTARPAEENTGDRDAAWKGSQTTRAHTRAPTEKVRLNASTKRALMLGSVSRGGYEQTYKTGKRGRHRRGTYMAGCKAVLILGPLLRNAAASRLRYPAEFLRLGCCISPIHSYAFALYSPHAPRMRTGQLRQTKHTRTHTHITSNHIA